MKTSWNPWEKGKKAGRTMEKNPGALGTGEGLVGPWPPPPQHATENALKSPRMNGRREADTSGRRTKSPCPRPRCTSPGTVRQRRQCPCVPRFKRTAGYSLSRDVLDTRTTRSANDTNSLNEWERSGAQAAGGPRERCRQATSFTHSEAAIWLRQMTEAMENSVARE